jgi:drug/metabolite transporter (DMT)-like permease
MIERKTLLADFALLGVTVIWGGTFVTVKHLLASTPPLAILLWRFLVAFGVLLVFSRPRTFRVLFAGTLLGGALFLGYLFQTLGLLYVTPARSAFITGLCTLIVPIFALVMLRTRPEKTLPVSIALALFGLFLLTSGNGEKTPLLVGDFLTFLGAVAYALQIVLVERFAKSNDAFALATVEMGAVALFSALSGVLFGEGHMLPGGFSPGGASCSLVLWPRESPSPCRRLPSATPRQPTQGLCSLPSQSSPHSSRTFFLGNASQDEALSDAASFSLASSQHSYASVLAFHLLDF